MILHSDVAGRPRDEARDEARDKDTYPWNKSDRWGGPGEHPVGCRNDQVTCVRTFGFPGGLSSSESFMLLLPIDSSDRGSRVLEGHEQP